jgi:putative ABC transport system permease protein
MARTHGLGGLREDARAAFRQLKNAPAFTVAAVLALALGIGAATTIFSVIQHVLLDPYPMYAHVDRMVAVQIHDASNPKFYRDSYQPAEFLEYQSQAKSLEEVIAGANEPAVFSSPQGAEEFVGGVTSGNTFTFMGVSAAVGRTITMDDTRPDAPPVFVMSYKTWTSRFGQDPGIIGRTFIWNGTARTLVGVMPPRVSKLGADVWRPIRLDPADASQADHFFRFQARLRPGVTIEQAQAEVAVLAPQIARRYPKNYPPRFTVEVVGLIDSIVGPFRKTLYTMTAAVGLLLLIACANVANMLLSRAAGREREMAIRGALGATRLRQVRQLLVESSFLAALGVGAGCLLAQVGITLLVRAIPEGLIPREALIQLDTRVLIFSVILAAVTVVIFGLAPALQSARADLADPLRDTGKGTGGGFRRKRLSSTLVIAEIGLSLVLLNCAGLLMRSFVKLQSTELGFVPENVLYVGVAVNTSLTGLEPQRQVLAQALEKIRAIPGVVAASSTTGFPPFGGSGVEFDVLGIPHDDHWRAELEYCSDDYFRALGMRIVRGRDFTRDDMRRDRQTALVNQALVERYLKGSDPIGRIVTLNIRTDAGVLEDRRFEIVGVVADARNQGVTERPASEVFLPYGAASVRLRGFIVKTSVAPLALAERVKREIWAVHRGVAIGNAGSVTDYLKQYSYSEPRLGLFVFSAFAGIGLVLVILGVYSLVAYTVARQTREIGIRIAVGASRGDVLRMTLGLGLRWIGAGVCAGLLASVAVTRMLANQLFDTSPTDPLTLTFVVTVIAVSAVAACYFPARRAMRVDPMIILRAE